jgi:hypothetical protein
MNSGALFINLGYSAALIYLPLQIYLSVRCKGIWRAMSLLPMFVMLPMYAIAAAGMIQKNNLWPVNMILVSPVAVLYLAALFIMHRASRH